MIDFGSCQGVTTCDGNLIVISLVGKKCRGVDCNAPFAENFRGDRVKVVGILNLIIEIIQFLSLIHI